MPNGNKPGPLAPYWSAFIGDILKYVVFIPAIRDSNKFGWFLATVMVLGDLISIGYNIYEHGDFKLLIMSLVAGSFVEGSK